MSQKDVDTAPLRLTRDEERSAKNSVARLSSLVAASRDILVAPGGKIAQTMGWPTFFLITVAAGIPCILLLPFIAPWKSDLPTGAVQKTVETNAGPAGQRDLLDEGRVEAELRRELRVLAKRGAFVLA